MIHADISLTCSYIDKIAKPNVYRFTCAVCLKKCLISEMCKHCEDSLLDFFI